MHRCNKGRIRSVITSKLSVCFARGSIWAPLSAAADKSPGVSDAGMCDKWPERHLAAWRKRSAIGLLYCVIGGKALMDGSIKYVSSKGDNEDITYIIRT